MDEHHVLQHANHLKAELFLSFLRDAEMARRLGDGSHEELSPAKDFGKEAGPEGPCEHSEGIIGLFGLGVKRSHREAVSDAAVAFWMQGHALV